MSATGSNGNENTAEDERAGRSAEHDAVLHALLRARRDASAPVPGVFGLDAGPEPEPDEVPLRSRGGGVNKPRAAVPTPVLAAEAARLVDSAHTKRARMVSAIGLPAVFLAATGVAVVPTVANAASSSSAKSAAATNCAPGSTAQANPGIKAAPSTASSSAPTSAPKSAASSSSTKANTTAKTPGAPQPSSGSTTAPPAAPSSRPSSAPSGTAPAKPSPTGVPSVPAPTSSTSTKPAAPTSTPSPSSSSSAPWWDPLGWLGTTVNGVFNPAPTSSSSSSTVNKLSAAPAANPASDPSSSTSPSPILSIGLGGSSSSSSSPSGAPTSKPSTPTPTTPTTPQPTSSESKPSAPTSTSSSSAPSTAPSTSSSSSGAPGTITYQGKTYQLPATSCVAAAAPNALREVEWHLDASSLTLTNQHFVAFQDINTGDGKTVQVMVIHADRVDLTDMVTYNEDGNTKVYSDGGKGKNVTLTNVTLHVLQQKGVMDVPILGIPLGEVTLGPPGEAGTDATSQLVMGLLQLNLPLPPVTFKDVHVDQYTLTSDTLDIPHFNVSLTGTTPQY